MESLQHCAYNQTKGCFLSLEVTAGEFAPTNLDDGLSKLTPESGAGMWLTPFRGLPANGVSIPLDLVYLDKDCRVIAVVESFPIFRVPPSIPPPASVLALPTHSIASTQTQRGDVLLVCASEEMASLMQQFTDAKASGGTSVAVEGAVSLSEGAAGSLDAGTMQSADYRTEQRLSSRKIVGKAPVKPERRSAKPTRGWLDRWLFPDDPDEDPDQRNAPRALAPGLAAHFFTGGPPQQHTIRDISATGLYLVTAERWYPGTVIRVTLTKTDEGDPTAERSITVQARVVRSDDDGVGLEFVLMDPPQGLQGRAVAFGGADIEQFRQFLMGLRRSKR